MIVKLLFKARSDKFSHLRLLDSSLSLFRLSLAGQFMAMFLQIQPGLEVEMLSVFICLRRFHAYIILLHFVSGLACKIMTLFGQVRDAASRAK